MTYPSAQRIPDVGKDRETYVIVLLFRVKYVITTLPRGFKSRWSSWGGNLIRMFNLGIVFLTSIIYLKRHDNMFKNYYEWIISFEFWYLGPHIKGLCRHESEPHAITGVQWEAFDQSPCYGYLISKKHSGNMLVTILPKLAFHFSLLWLSESLTGFNRQL